MYGYEKTKNGWYLIGDYTIRNKWNTTWGFFLSTWDEINSVTRDRALWPPDEPHVQAGARTSSRAAAIWLEL